jgi:hypothetical protein
MNNRLNNSNFLDNLEQANLMLASHKMIQGADITKKRNKSSTKSYNNKDNMDNIDLSYCTQAVKKNNFINAGLDLSLISSNHNSIVKNIDT